MAYISFILKSTDLKIGAHVVKTLFNSMEPADYKYYTQFSDFFRCLKRVCSVFFLLDTTHCTLFRHQWRHIGGDER